MTYNLLSNISYCSEYVSEIQDILLYSHLVPAIVALLLAGYTFFQTRTRLTWLLVQISLIFLIWIGFNLAIWFSYANASILMFAWSQIEVVTAFLFFSTLLFFYHYLHGQDLGLLSKGLLLIPLLPLIIFSSSFYLTGYDAQECIGIENELYLTYVKFVKFLYAFLIFSVLLKNIFNKNRLRAKAEVLILGAGLLVFLYTFFIATYIAELTVDFRYEMAGLFSFVLFIACLTYLITNYQTFEIKLVGAKVIVTALILLSGTQVLFFTSTSGRVVDIITVILVCIFSYLLIRSIKREIQQREQLEELTEQLATANIRLKELDKLKSEFVSIASHQLRSPLTSMRGYASMLADGSYGVIPEKAKEAIERIADSSAFMAKMVENYLNVSRIESGNMKYELSDFNLKQEVEKTIDDKRQEAMKKGLLLTFKSELVGQGIVHADIGKSLEIVHNLLNNALKYTPSGSIDVFVHDDQKKKKIYVDIHDSGIGMTQEDIAKLFGKFSRAANANSVNTTGTGLGLYVARTMALAMKGDITARSEGQGKGSTFTLELPLMM